MSVLLAVEVAAFTISTLPGVRAEEGFDPLLDGWLQGTAYVTAALLCVLRPIAVRTDRAVWTWLAAALVMRALAFVLFLSVVREMEPIPYPSVSDIGWLAMSVLVLIGLVTLVRAHFTRVSRSLILDGLVGGLATAALALALLYGTLVDLTAEGTPSSVVATNLAYPITDVVLLLVILGVLVAFHWRPPAAVWLLGGAVAAFAVTDSLFLYQVTAGTFRPGALVSALSLIPTATIAWVAWVPRGERESRRSAALPGLVVPAVFALVCLGVLVYATGNDVPPASVALAAAGIVLGVVRAALTLRDFQMLSRELREQGELLRFARDEAERASGAKSEFVSGMSHELRTPLNSVLGFAQLIELDAVDDNQRGYARRIIGAGRHLVEMIDDLLDISRLEHGEVRASIERVSVTEVVREALDLTEPLVAERGLGLDCDARAGDHRYVLADFRRLRQVLINLISNAAKYNRERGKITVLVTEPAEGTVRFEVTDTGAGIEESDLGRLFRPFERLEATSGTEPGTGLGLAVSRGLTEEMGGQIGVRSRVGTGTTFHVDLPAADATAAAEEDARRGGPQVWAEGELLSATILYVEDNPANIRLMEGIFAGQPRVRLITTTRGEGAAELAERHSPDLVLLDVHLPDMDGEDVLHRLGSRKSTASIPVIVVSADATPARRERFLSAGAAGYATKPIDVESFVTTVQTLLNQDSGARTGPSSSTASSVRNPSTTSGSN